MRESCAVCTPGYIEPPTHAEMRKLQKQLSQAVADRERARECIETLQACYDFYESDKEMCAEALAPASPKGDSEEEPS